MKPENILIEKDPETEEVCNIKLTDFGLSKIAVPNEIMHESCGTPAYVAPEVLHKKGYKKEVDMWSAGVIMYQLFGGCFPFEAPELEDKIVAEEADFSTGRWSTVSS